MPPDNDAPDSLPWWFIHSAVSVLVIVVWAAVDAIWRSISPSELEEFATAAHYLVGVGGIAVVIAVVAVTWRRKIVLPWAVGSLVGGGLWIVAAAPVGDLWLPMVAGAVVAWRTAFPFHRLLRVLLLAGGAVVFSDTSWRSVESALLGFGFGSNFSGLLHDMGPLFGLVLIELAVGIAVGWVRGATDRDAVGAIDGKRWLAGGVAALLVTIGLWLPGRLPTVAPVELADSADTSVRPDTLDRLHVYQRGVAASGWVSNPTSGSQRIRVDVRRHASAVIPWLLGRPDPFHPSDRLLEPPDPTAMVNWHRYHCWFAETGSECGWEYGGRNGQYAITVRTEPMTEAEFLDNIDRVLRFVGDVLS